MTVPVALPDRHAEGVADPAGRSSSRRLPSRRWLGRTRRRRRQCSTIPTRSTSETSFGEDKATIAGAGNRTSGPVLRSGSPRLVIQEAWAWLTAIQLVRASEAAALRAEAAAARALRRRNQQEVTADEESFTAALRHAIRSMTSTQVTASSSLHTLAASADAAARAALPTLNVPGRQRHSPRAQKARPKFPHAPPRPR